MSMEDIGGLKGEVQIDVGPFVESMKSLTAALAKFDQQTTQTQDQLGKVESQARKAGDASTGFKLSIGNLIPQLTAANIATRAFYDGLHLLEEGFTDPIKQAAKFQQTMANVSSLIKGDATPQMKQFNAAVLEMSKTIPKDPNDLGAGLYEVISANFTKTADALSILNVAAKGAVGGLTSTKTSVDAITTVLNAYQLKASDAQAVSDSLFVTVRDGKLSYEELANSLGLVVSTAALAKVPLDQMNAALVSLTLSGQQSSHAATDLNQFLDSVIKASKGTNDAAKMAKQLGIEYDVTALHSMGLAKFIQQVADKAGGSDVAIQTLTGDVRAFRGLAVLAGNGLDSFNMALEDMKDKAGTADTAFQRNTDTLNNNWILAWNNLNAILIDAGQQKLPAMQAAVDQLTQVMNDNQGAIESAAGALSSTLITAMTEVVEYTPTIINAINIVAQSISAVASGISTYLHIAGQIGEDVTANAVKAAGAIRGGSSWDNAVIYSDQIHQAHSEGKLFRDVMNEGLDTTNANIKFQEQNGIGAGKQQVEIQKQKPNNSNNKPTPSVGGGGAKENTKALDDAKKVLEDIKKIQDDISKVQEEQIKQNKTRADALRDELTLKKQMGIISSDEQRTLDRLNDRVEYQTDKIKDATAAWKDQVKVVEDLQKKITDINKQIQAQDDDLQKTLKDIDKETAKSTTDEIGRMMSDKKDLQDKLASHQGLSDQEQQQLQKLTDDLATAQGGGVNQDTADQIAKLQGDKAMILQNGKPNAAALAKVSDIDRQVAGLQTTQDPYNEAAKLATMSPLEKIQYDAQQKKKDAAQTSNVKTDDLISQLGQANTDLVSAQKTLKDKIDAVTSAQKDQQTTIAASYKTIQENTAAHVKSQIAQLDLERSHVDALANSYANVKAFIADPLNLNGGKPIPGHADGGMITGPGTGTSDSILARLSNGEYVMPAAATSAYRPILDAMRSMQFTLPRFATGGPVSTDNSRSIHIEQNYSGDAARLMSRPDLLRWHARMALS